MRNNFVAFLETAKTNSKSGEDVSQITCSQSPPVIEKSRIKTDIQLKKDHKLVRVEGYPICIKCSASVFNVCLAF